MSKKKITFERLEKFSAVASEYLQTIGKRKTKLKYAIERVADSVNYALKIKSNKIDNFRIDAASTDLNGDLIINEGKRGEDKYNFKPEKLKEFKDKAIALANEEIDVEVFITSNYPDLSWPQFDAFKGIIIPDDATYIEEYDEEEVEQDGSLLLSK